MKIKLTLHEAIVVVLIGKPNRTATTKEISDKVNERGLYKQKDGDPVESNQIMARTKLSNGRYHHLLENEEPGIVSLKNFDESI